MLKKFTTFLIVTGIALTSSVVCFANTFTDSNVSSGGGTSTGDWA